jgi:hypothetical protein
VVVSGALPSDFSPICLTLMTSSNLVGCKPDHWHLRLLTFPMRTADANNDGQTRDLPGSDAIHLRVMCSSAPAGRQCLA